MSIKGKCKCCLSKEKLIRHHIAYKGLYRVEEDEIVK